MSASSPAGLAPRSAFRPEIQALRAVAVLLVVVYHLWPLRLPGGYVGVDVFFVISGFLITSHLIRDAERSGRVVLSRFWARRARRLLPASLLVIAVSMVGTFLLIPQALWQQFFREFAASAIYVQNWALASASVNYLAQGDSDSPVLHYWSLSVEEQFYLAWPLLILAALLLARRAPRLPPRSAIALVLGAATAASLAVSVVQTVTNPEVAYFSTLTRAWEFGAGGLLACFIAAEFTGLSVPRIVLAWGGYAAILASAVLYRADTPFPGSAALLPVLGTAAVIAAGSPRGPLSPTPLAAFRPTRFLGDVSYSLYLWHWPLIVLVPAATDRDLTTLDKLLVFAACVLLAWLTKRFVEDPGRTVRVLVARRSRWTFVAVGAATAVLLSVSGAAWVTVQARVDAILAANEDRDALDEPCAGADALDPANACAEPFAVPPGLLPAATAQDRSRGILSPPFVEGGCLQLVETEPFVCEAGDPDGEVTIALLGDSHLGQLFDAFEVAGEEAGWRIVTYLRAGCMPAGGGVFLSGSTEASERAACQEWGTRAMAAVLGDPEIDAVAVLGRYAFYDDPSTEQVETPTVEQLRASYADVLAGGKRVVAVRDTPRTFEDRDSPTCIDENLAVYDPCWTPSVLGAEDAAMAAVAPLGPDAAAIDLTSSFCDAERCHALVGGIPVYVDDSHLTAAYARTLATPLLAQLRPALERWSLP